MNDGSNESGNCYENGRVDEVGITGRIAGRLVREFRKLDLDR